MILIQDLYPTKKLSPHILWAIIQEYFSSFILSLRCWKTKCKYQYLRERQGDGINIYILFLFNQPLMIINRFISHQYFKKYLYFLVMMKILANLRCILLPFYNLQRLRHKWKPPKEIFVSSRNNQPKQQFSKLPMEWTCKKLDVDPNTSNFSYTIFPFKAAYHINLRFAVFAKTIQMYILHEAYFVYFYMKFK